MDFVLPILVVRTDVPSLIEVNGDLCGEVSASGHLALPLSDTGDYYLCAIPLTDSKDVRRFAVTRKLSVRDGKLCPPEAEDVRICAWPGGVYEILLSPGSLPVRENHPFPYSIAELEWREGNRERHFTLYYEGGLRLAAEEGGQIISGFSLGEGGTGELSLLDVGEARVLLAKTAGMRGERMLAFDFFGEVLLDIVGDAVCVEDGCPASIKRYPTFRKHERRQKYDHKGGQFFAMAEEPGFFTAEGVLPRCDRETAIAFCEAVREGFREEAWGYLDPELAGELDFEEVRTFLGEFFSCRVPFSDDSGRFLGLIRRDEGRMDRATLLRFEFENGRITNISEE